MQNNISVIIPIHSTDNKTVEYLRKAFNSASSKVEEILFVCTPKCIDEIKNNFENETSTSKVQFVLNEGESDFCSQVNFGIKNASCEFISILELDDEYSETYFDLIKEHMDYHKEVQVFLPITIDVDLDEKVITLSNVAAWVSGNIEKQGYIDLSSLLKNPSYSLSGSVVKKSLFEEYGYFKSSMKLSFGYELLLRFVYNGVEVKVINKMGYKHLNGRPNSLFSLYRQENTPLSLQYGEADFWIDLAKKEYFFKDDRKITFVQS
jgi:hypothetical protein